MVKFFDDAPFAGVSEKYANLCNAISGRDTLDDPRVRLRDLARAIRGEIGPEDVEILTRREG